MESGISMVERVAKAICLTQWGGYPVDRQEREAWTQWTEALKMARAAIEAMREPTDEMGRRVREKCGGFSDSRMYREFIDAALKQHEEAGK